MCAAKIKKPVVIQSKEFLEIAGDFANPLEITREAISNSFDANARNIWLSFSMEEDYDEKIFKITIKDDGEGMNEKELEAFYDLGNSTRRNDKEKIGEKGHGTKVYLNSNKIEVNTVKNNKCLKSKMSNMKKLLYKGQIPEYTVEEINKIPFPKGTEIIITGFNNNKTDKFTHERLKDYILWFTKFGSIDKEIGINKFIDTKIYLKGIDRDKYETLSYGHVFPPENSNTTKLLDTYGTDAPEYYCRRWDFQGVLKAHPFIKYKAVFYIEGNKVKQSYNSMIKRPGPHEPEGAYRVQDRYGLWLCKDYIPIERMNSWITTKGNEYTKFHAFFNCQEFKLTANRGSLENTDTEIMQDIESTIRGTYTTIMENDDIGDLEYLEKESKGFKTVNSEEKDFKRRKTRISKSNIANYKGLTLVEPIQESGVFAIVVQLMVIEPNLFPFQIVDYDTHSGIDVIAKEKNLLDIESSTLYYVEFKYILTKEFNHSFEYLYSIICWDTEIKDGGEVEDLKGNKRTLKIVPVNIKSNYKKYYLDDPNSIRKIEIFVLKDYLKDKLNIEFRPRIINMDKINK